jgi:hypothetical protein
MWKTGEINGYPYEAKVFDIGSIHGINGGRVSKLMIWKNVEGSLPIYNYDRGLDFDNAPDGLVDSILALYPEPEPCF